MRILQSVMITVLGLGILMAAPQEPKEDIDWGAKIVKKQVEIEDLIKILTPVVEAITEAREAGRTSDFVEEEWHDTETQLDQANKMYADCKARMAKGEKTKLLFLNLENTWQLYVKAGVSGVRTKSIIDSLPED